jgi:hypothetical protein
MIQVAIDHRRDENLFRIARLENIDDTIAQRSSLDRQPAILEAKRCPHGEAPEWRRPGEPLPL